MPVLGRKSPQIRVIVEQTIVHVIRLIQVLVSPYAWVGVTRLLVRVCQDFLRLGANFLQGLTRVQTDVFPLLKAWPSGFR